MTSAVQTQLDAKVTASAPTISFPITNTSANIPATFNHIGYTNTTTLATTYTLTTSWVNPTGFSTTLTHAGIYMVCLLVTPSAYLNAAISLSSTGLGTKDRDYVFINTTSSHTITRTYSFATSPNTIYGIVKQYSTNTGTVYGTSTNAAYAAQMTITRIA